MFHPSFDAVFAANDLESVSSTQSTSSGDFGLSAGVVMPDSTSAECDCPFDPEEGEVRCDGIELCKISLRVMK